MGKGTKRTKGKTLALGDFIGEQSSGNTINVDGRAVELPSAPRASTLEIDVTKLPPRPPYTAVVANLAYDITEDDLLKFFEGIELDSINIPRDEDSMDKRFKGVAYVSVNGPNAVDSLAHVLAKSNHMVLNRTCKIEIYEERGGRFGGKGRGGMDDPGFGRSEAGDWRRGGDSGGSDDRRGGYDDRRDDRRGGYDDRRGGYDDRDRRGGGGYDDRRGGYDDRRGGGYDDRRGGYDRYDDRSSSRYDDRRGGGYDRSGGRDDYGRDRRGGGGFGSSAADDDSSWRRSAPEIPERRDIPPERRREERPRLQLQKRTAPAESEGKASGGASSSIFGAAKPIDTSQKEKEIEEKLKKLSVDSHKDERRHDDRRNDDRRHDDRRQDERRHDDRRDDDRRDDDRRDDDRRPYRREEKEKLNPDERAHIAEEELKKRVEEGIDDARPECDRENVVVTSRFSALEDDE